ESDPLWTGNWTNVAFTNVNEVFDENVSFAKNISVDGNTLFVDSNTNRVGIGTTTPQTRLHIGTGTPNQEVHDGRELYVTNTAEFDGYVYFDGAVYVRGNYFETPLGYMESTSANSLGLDATWNTFVLTAYDNRHKNADHGTQLNPTLYIQSAINPDTNNTQWVSLTHNQTNAVFDIGSGSYIFSNGRVGIGTASPKNTLNVIGDGNFTGNLYSNGAQVLTSYTETDPLWTGNFSAKTGTGNVVFSSSPTITSPTISTSINLPSGAVDAAGEISNDIITNAHFTHSTDWGDVSVDASGLVQIDSGTISDAEVSSLSWSELNNYPTACGSNQYISVFGDTLTCASISGLGSSNINDIYLFNTGDTATGDYNFDSNTFVIDSTDNKVGIGTASPDYPFQVEKSSATDYVLADFRNTNSDAGAYANIYLGNDAATPYLQFRTSRLSGHADIGNPANQDLNLFTNGVANPRITIKDDGDVGIGTTSPDVKLTVNGNIASVRGSGVNTSLTMYGANNTKGNRIIVGADDTSAYIKGTYGTEGSSDIRFLNVNTETMRLKSGKVGIGTSSPDAPLEIHSGDYDILHLHELDTGGGLIRFTNTDDSDGWYAGITGGERFGISRNTNPDSGKEFIILQTGEVGIGTATPDAKLEVLGDIVVRETDDGNDAVDIYSTATQGVVDVLSGGVSKVKLRGDGATYFTGGNVGIGTESPSTMLDIAGGSILIDAGQFIYGHDTTGNRGFLELYDAATGDVNLGTTFSTGDVVFTAGNNERVRILSGGNVGIGTANPNSKLVLSGSGNQVFAINSTSDAANELVGLGTGDFVVAHGEGGEISFRIGTADGNNYVGSGDEKMVITNAGNVG
ncbi:MAG: hypothetical protein ACTSO3_16520, partial [Candidatus Heimdallarchaeaceae archaeon]